ncbi:unnamed protein product [Staurois parvus]|uniref:Uncharacterized protein n=1 Tax=Staurois parvus TaxID=386267 RepID=A0ABN9ETB5_9NEOB|nr:unnamed protein product [Staurois parvus]
MSCQSAPGFPILSTVSLKAGRSVNEVQGCSSEPSQFIENYKLSVEVSD